MLKNDDYVVFSFKLFDFLINFVVHKSVDYFFVVFEMIFDEFVKLCFFEDLLLLFLFLLF